VGLVRSHSSDLRNNSRYLSNTSRITTAVSNKKSVIKRYKSTAQDAGTQARAMPQLAEETREEWPPGLGTCPLVRMVCKLSSQEAEMAMGRGTKIQREKVWFAHLATNLIQFKSRGDANDHFCGQQGGRRRPGLPSKGPFDHQGTRAQHLHFLDGLQSEENAYLRFLTWLLLISFTHGVDGLTGLAPFGAVRLQMQTPPDFRQLWVIFHSETYAMV
jgi:hypothetical protein